ncbi:hypothetical protein ACFQH9_28350 [Pseudonocardia lutea]|uniref:Uncharacterized protein n=1 Tax=Pseudonocardia lutea TaxID=2172015 RepID=A0ABW1IEP4_9PSEU
MVISEAPFPASSVVVTTASSIAFRDAPDDADLDAVRRRARGVGSYVVCSGKDADRKMLRSVIVS